MQRKAWSEYRIGTKAYSASGGYWIKNLMGWHWSSGNIYSSPGGDVCDIVEPDEDAIFYRCSDVSRCDYYPCIRQRIHENGAHAHDCETTVYCLHIGDDIVCEEIKD